MTASLDPTYIPSHAVTIWADDRNIYVAIPRSPRPPAVQSTIQSTVPIPYITTFPINEQGLSKALHILKQRYEELPAAQKNYTLPPIAVTKVKSVSFKSSEEDRTAALAILRKMGIV